MPGTSATRSAVASVSAGIAAATAHLPKSSDPGPRFPAEDGGRSLAEMAHADLDAALQLLAERAQYITEASGAAIALRRGERNDMLCRASTGSNAPELGALLSMEYGLSGECVRTRQPLRCDDAERDPRVNREACQQLGIASVVVMPIVSDDQVLGIFELLSGKPHAFDQRDLSALQRMSEMVETAVKHAAVAPTASALQEPPAPELTAADLQLQPPVDAIVPPLTPPISATFERDIPLAEPDIVFAPPQEVLPPPVLAKTELEKPRPEPAPASKKPLFWSAAVGQGGAGRADEAAPLIAVPPVLRNLQKCQACGFPVSQGRTFCVECEEKQWRGQRPPAQGKVPAPSEVAAAPAIAATPENTATIPIEPSLIAAQPSLASSAETRDISTDVPASDNSTLFLSSAAPAESWFASNKYILGALLVVAIVIAAIAWLR